MTITVAQLQALTDEDLARVTEQNGHPLDWTGPGMQSVIEFIDEVTAYFRYQRLSRRQRRIRNALNRVAYRHSAYRAGHEAGRAYMAAWNKGWRNG